MKILILKGGFGTVYEPAWQNALQSLGHEVHIFDCHQHTLPSIFGKFERKYFLGPSLWNIRSKSIEAAKSFQPDVILVYQGHYHNLESIRALSKIAWTTGYHNDNPFSARMDGRHFFRYRNLIPSLPAYDSYHAYRDVNIKDFQQAGVNKVKTLMAYYIPEIDKPIPSINPDLGADVIFAGHPEADGREDYIQALTEKSIHFKLYGDGIFWKKILPTNTLNQLNTIRVLSPADYRIAHNSSKICLSFFSHWNRDTYTRRVFEIPAMCKFLMTTRTETMRALYEEDKEAVYFSSKEEMLDKINFYLKNNAAREQIAQAGFQRCTTSGYDIQSRMRQWTNDIEQWKGK